MRVLTNTHSKAFSCSVKAPAPQQCCFFHPDELSSLLATSLSPNSDTLPSGIPIQPSPSPARIGPLLDSVSLTLLERTWPNSVLILSVHLSASSPTVSDMQAETMPVLVFRWSRAGSEIPWGRRRWLGQPALQLSPHLPGCGPF